MEERDLSLEEDFESILNRLAVIIIIRMRSIYHLIDKSMGLDTWGMFKTGDNMKVKI